ncbi:MAG TPA: LysM peptidoglycan-binding domain-containing protein, partial [Candidatus Sulfotelmatobacter sp.]|nr:LysM peptidoglycan-binding domain-containing protein [Candidatus Sulfotelmatobacter sp.]
GMTRKALQAANPDIPMAKLKVGQALVIPVEHWAETNAAPKAVSKASYQSKPLPATTPYVVSRGDTAKKIAKKHGISVSALLTANPGLDPARMKVGQMLAIPQKPGRPSAVLKNGQKH